MSTESETGWSKEWPAEDGFYWSRDTPEDTNILLVEVHRNRLTICGGNKMNVREAFEDSEFLGPITPADTEQLVRLRTVAEKALIILGGRSGLSRATKQAVDELRAVLGK